MPPIAPAARPERSCSSGPLKTSAPADDPRILQHLAQQGARERDARELGDVVDDEVRVRRRSGNVVPVLRDAVRRQVEVNGRDGSDRVHPQALGMGCERAAVGGVVAGDVGDDRDASFGGGHHVLQQQLALRDGLVDALSRGAADVQALDPLADQVLGEGAHPFGGDGALVVIAGVKGREDPLVFTEIHHSFLLPHRNTADSRSAGARSTVVPRQNLEHNS